MLLTQNSIAAIFIAAAAAAKVDLIVTNRCGDTIWPAANTQMGAGPEVNGFELASGETRNLTVDTNWNGRVWGRTNCTFDGEGRGNCLTGDCGGVLDCTTINPAVTLAEFNLAGAHDQSYYDISLVDGYNLPMAITAILDPANPSQPPANTTNPSCVGGPQDFAPSPFNPYTNSGTFLNTSSSDPLPFDTRVTAHDVRNWCPRDLEVSLPSSSSSVDNEGFTPCHSPCTRYALPIYCCTGSYRTSATCHANYYALAAKRVCPDAYSYAYDDALSTFTVPTGSGFEVVFCPGGRSTDIQRRLRPESGAQRVRPGLLLGALGVGVGVLGVGVW